MNNQSEKTIVVFRKWENGDVIAIFPEELGDAVYTCNSYMHFGQHGSCDPYEIVGQTVPAKPKEYADLQEELENYGDAESHYVLDVRKHITWRNHAVRITKYHRIFDENRVNVARDMGA